jgi:hypothetical protein
MIKEIKSDKIKEIIEQENLMLLIKNLKNDIEKLKINNTEATIKRELNIFENRLVNKLYSLNKNNLNLKMKG